MVMLGDSTNDGRRSHRMAWSRTYADRARQGADPTWCRQELLPTNSGSKEEIVNYAARF